MLDEFALSCGTPSMNVVTARIRRARADAAEPGVAQLPRGELVEEHVRRAVANLADAAQAVRSRSCRRPPPTRRPARPVPSPLPSAASRQNRKLNPKRLVLIGLRRAGRPRLSWAAA